MNKPKLMSIFAGGGGLDEGFKAAGYDVSCSIDLEEWACDTLRKNNPQSQVIGPPQYSGDVKAMSPEEVSKITGIQPNELDMIMGGPPCQPFSQAASQRFLKTDMNFKRKGFDCEDKGTLLFNFIEYVLFFKPKNFLIENVPGLLTVDGGKQLNVALKTLQDAGYIISEPKIIDAVNYGIPQYRQRLIIWGSTEVKKPELPEPSHSSAADLISPPQRVVAQALSNLSSELKNTETRAHKELSVERYKTLEFGQREKRGRVDRLNPFKPSKTVIAGGMKGGGRSHLHPFIARTMSVRECARIQTFSDSYEFTGSIARQFTQVGNAVPPLLAEKIAYHILNKQYGITVPNSFKHEVNLNLDTPVETLVNNMLIKAINEKPEWVYNSHSEASKGKKRA
ncbi:DNA cytosine methyltransferase [Colwellia sp. RSH04]|uniref:DNA cytosine methyltransferase n=1 Tax=Colwellia sp. RSH04 TaxID=2305464 RepID=UPI000E588DB9|nr:DNA cytosine methyltransferase [Colwellia sp. RSH04]RHW77572.1 DNA cytosine methyltransferase [Colwellia sp. RSH04]